MSGLTDIRCSNMGTIWILAGASSTGEAWLSENLFNPNDEDGQPEMWAGGYVVEHRYVQDILEGAMAEGLVIA